MQCLLQWRILLILTTYFTQMSARVIFYFREGLSPLSANLIACRESVRWFQWSSPELNWPLMSYNQFWTFSFCAFYSSVLHLLTNILYYNVHVMSMLICKKGCFCIKKGAYSAPFCCGWRIRIPSSRLSTLLLYHIWHAENCHLL